MKNIVKTLSVALAFTLFVWAGDALAQTTSQDAFSIAFGKVADAFLGAKQILFVIGGFGLIAIAFLAIFGKINWKWFTGLLVGLAIVAAAGMIVTYATGEDSWDAVTDDTFQYSAGF